MGAASGDGFMTYSKQELWERFKKYYVEFPEAGLAVDLSRMDISEGFFSSMESRMQKAFADMAALEAGAIANPDEGRMVGHYWLRNPALAPSEAIRKEIEDTLFRIEAFGAEVHAGRLRGAGGVFRNLLIIGIGGSALGPQFVAKALGHPQRDKLRPFFFDNTDPDGMDRVLAEIGSDLGRTLCLVISKSGGTKETRNGMLEAAHAYEKEGWRFGQHAVAITRPGSELDSFAVGNEWITAFPMWDWIGGRTSELSAVGLLPAALQGFDINGMIAGAKACDQLTRRRATAENPAALLALSWLSACRGIGERNMVVIPYKDRLELLGRYLQQLVMESLGKRTDLSGNVVSQGISVFGNKGSTDQHSYVQQLRDGMDDFFVTFIEVLSDREMLPPFVETELTSGDFLHGFYLGTRQAIAEGGRQSISVTCQNAGAFTIGALIALFERTVGYYALLVNINAYNQPGVEAGKKAANDVLVLKTKVLSFLREHQYKGFSAHEIAKGIGAADEVEHVFRVCEHLAANRFREVEKTPSKIPTDSRFSQVGR